MPSRGTALEFIAGPTLHDEFAGFGGGVLSTGDVDGDGYVDIVVTAEGTQHARVILTECSLGDARRGDVNIDGSLDIADPVMLLNHLFGGGPLTCRPAAEVTGDGNTDISDPVYLLNYLFAAGSPPVGTAIVRCDP